MKYQKKLLFVTLAYAVSNGAFAQNVQVKQIEAQQKSTLSGSASSLVAQNTQGNNNDIATQNINAQSSDPISEESKFGNWSASGNLMQQAAMKTSGNQNIMNSGGNPFNGVQQANHGLGQVDPSLNNPNFANATTIYGRSASLANNTSMNLLSTQGTFNLDGKFNENWSAHFKALYYTDELSSNTSNIQGGGQGMQTYFGGANNGGQLGIAKNNNLLSLPVAYFDYSNGPLWIRAGNQQIAWGEAIFFRISDLANGLDLRQHSLFGIASEEFSNIRTSSPAIRANYDFGGGNKLDTFVEQFKPTIMPGSGTAYNAIPSQFIITNDGYNTTKNNINVGGKFQGNIDSVDVGYQLFAVNRNNPDGVYQWTAAQGNPAGALSGTAFSASGKGGNGIASAQEWYSYSSASNLNAVGALTSALNMYGNGTSAAVSGGCAAFAAALGTTAPTCTLDTLFGAAGPLNGWLSRQYQRENVVGGGLNKVFSGELDSVFDQLIGRVEVNYTPNKTFTNPTLGNYLIQSDMNSAVILEKYQKFSQNIPATYIVGQWMHRTASDIFGRSLLGAGTVNGSTPTGVGGGANYLALVVQQPSPTLEYRFDLTVLNDTRGGTLIQPGVKWKVNKTFQADAYYNYVASATNNGTSFTQNLKYANEAYLRLTAFF